jgi:molybdopterin-guanine dinucleotide biosynthesis protein A
MCDEIYYYRDQVKELQAINSFVKSNTLLSVQNRIEYIKDEREKLGLPLSGIEMALEVVRTMLNEK